MQEVVQETRTTAIHDLDLLTEVNCSQVRKQLDDLFSRRQLLEDTRLGVKRLMFEHLENCRSCCRAFDVRVRFRPAQRYNIY